MVPGGNIHHPQGVGVAKFMLWCFKFCGLVEFIYLTDLKFALLQKLCHIFVFINMTEIEICIFAQNKMTDFFAVFQIYLHNYPDSFDRLGFSIFSTVAHFFFPFPVKIRVRTTTARKLSMA